MSAPKMFPTAREMVGFKPIQPEFDRGSRFDSPHTLPCEEELVEEMKTPKLKRCNALTPSAPSRPRRKDAMVEEDEDEATETFAPFVVPSISRKLEFAKMIPSKATWSLGKIQELVSLWKTRQVELRSAQHADEIAQLVEFIYDNNAQTLFPELQKIIGSATSPRDLEVEVYHYSHATPNGNDLRYLPYFNEDDGEVYPTMQQMLHEKGYESVVPHGINDVHWIVKKTDFLKNLAARFGPDNFTASYKLILNTEYKKNFFYSDAIIYLHFWPKGISKTE